MLFTKPFSNKSDFEKLTEGLSHRIMFFVPICTVNKNSSYGDMIWFYLQDEKGTTPLHLAAARGSVDAITYLLNAKHPVSCIDQDGWPPLLYANFQTDKQCVIELFNKNPAQLFCLGQLMSAGEDEEKKMKNTKVLFLCSLTFSFNYFNL